MNPGPKFLRDVLTMTERLGSSFTFWWPGRGEEEPFYAHEMTICVGRRA